MPIERLPGLATSWTEVDSTANILSMIADPFWQAKAGADPNNAILFRSGVGFIERSIDAGENWLDVTPAIDPPNNAGDSPAPTVGNVAFSQLDGSISIPNEFVVLARWQNGSSEWRSWMAYTDDSGVSWSWKAIVIGGSPSVDSFGSTTDIGDIDVVSLAGQGNICGFRNMCFLSDTKAIVLREQDSSPYNLQYNVMTISGDTITPGTWGDVDVSPDVNEPYYGMSVVPIDSSKVLVAWTYFDGFSDYGVKLRVGSVSGTTITWGAEISFIDGSYGATSVDVAVLSTLFAVVTYSLGNNDIRARVISISGTSLTANAEYTVEATNAAGLRASICPLDDTKSIICYNNSNGNNNIGMAKVATRSGTALSFGSAAQFSASGKAAHWIKCVSLTSSLFVVGFTQKETISVWRANSTAGTVSGTTITFGLPTQLSADDHDSTDIVNIDAINDDQFLFSRQEGVADDEFSIGTISGTAIAYSTIVDNTGVSSGLSHVISVLSGSKAVFAYYKNESGPPDRIGGYTVNFTAGAAYGKGIGISIGKGLGNRAWVTFWDDVAGLSLVDIAIPLLTLSGSYALGAATEGEINAKTWIAYPYSLPGDDDLCIAYGRMDAPQSLASPEHVIYTIDGGAAFFSLINDWGSVYCGSVQAHPSGIVFAVKNNGASSQLFSGNLSKLAFKSTLPHASGVTQQGLAVDLINKSVVASAISAGAIMVALTPTPYEVWENTTLNHDNTIGTTSVVIL